MVTIIFIYYYCLETVYFFKKNVIFQFAVNLIRLTFFVAFMIFKVISSLIFIFNLYGDFLSKYYLIPYKKN